MISGYASSSSSTTPPPIPVVALFGFAPPADCPGASGGAGKAGGGGGGDGKFVVMSSGPILDGRTSRLKYFPVDKSTTRWEALLPDEP